MFISMSLSGLITVYVLVGLVMLFPIVRIVRRAGLSGSWAILSIIPIQNVFMLFIFAFVELPSLKGDV